MDTPGVQITLPSLDANSTYQFQVRATHDTNGNDSAWSSTRDVSTNPLVPMPPENFRSLAVTANSFTLLWDGQEELTNYTLEGRIGGEAWQPWATLEANAISVPISGVASSTVYEFRLTATNASGSATSILSVTTYPVAPSNFSTIQTVDSVAFTWTAQDNLTGYTLEYKKSIDPDSEWQIWMPAPGANVTGATITGLASSTAYNFRLTATNTSGSSAYATASATTIPAAPPNFRVASQTINSVTLVWDGQSNLNGYTLEYKTETGWMKWFDPETTATSATITSLLSSTVYDFRLTATNASGSSEHATDSGLTLPLSPTNFRSTSQTDDSVTLAWNSQSNLAGYTLEFKKSSVDTWSTYSNSINGFITTFNVTGLEHDTKYEFRLTARNASGNSNPAEVRDVETVRIGTNYAVLFAGGYNVSNNHERYYQSFRELYSVLVYQHGLARENIWVIYADGTDSGADRRNPNRSWLWDPLSINSDMSFANGSNVMQATGANLEAAFTTLGNKMTASDHLLFFTYDHGTDSSRSSSDIGNEKLCGWGENISAVSVAKSVEKIKEGHITLVFSQCFAGGILAAIIDPITGQKKIQTNAKIYGMAASNHYEPAWSGFPSGFAGSFIAAISPHRGNKTLTNEIFVYAKTNDLFACNSVYQNNEGHDENKIEHPWGIGETFSIFVSASGYSYGSGPRIIPWSQENMLITNGPQYALDALEFVKSDSVYINFSYRNSLNADVSGTVTVVGDSLAQPVTFDLDNSSFVEDEDGVWQLATNLNLGTFGAGWYSAFIELFVEGEYTVLERSFNVAEVSLDIGDTLADAQSIVPGETEYIITGIIGDGIYGGCDVDIFRYDATDEDIGKTLVVATIADWTSTMPVDTYLRLFDAVGTELAQGIYSFNSGIMSLYHTITAAAVYYIGVSAFGNWEYDPNMPNSGLEGDAGMYQLEVHISETMPNLSMFYDFCWIDNLIITTDPTETFSYFGFTENDTIYINYKFVNDGFVEIDDPNVVNRVTITGADGYSRSEDFTMSALQPGEFQTLPQNFEWDKLGAGTYTITVTLDVNGVLGELSVDDNTVSWEFTVGRLGDAPVNLRATTTGQTALALQWNTIADATEYVLQRKGPGEDDFRTIYIGTNARYIDQNLTADTTYEYRVYAVGTVFSDVVSIKTAAAQINGNTATDMPMILPPALEDGKVYLRRRGIGRFQMTGIWDS